jgi:hypothetical protein
MLPSQYNKEQSLPARHPNARTQNQRFEQWHQSPKEKNKNGTSHWRAVICIKGYPTACNHFDRKQEAEDWANDVERE